MTPTNLKDLIATSRRLRAAGTGGEWAFDSCGDVWSTTETDPTVGPVGNSMAIPTVLSAILNSADQNILPLIGRSV